MIFQCIVTIQYDRQLAISYFYTQLNIFIFVGLIGKRIYKIVHMMDYKINDNARFKNIFNNIDESIILINT